MVNDTRANLIDQHEQMKKDELKAAEGVSREEVWMNEEETMELQEKEEKKKSFWMEGWRRLSPPSSLLVFLPQLRNSNIRL